MTKGVFLVAFGNSSYGRAAFNLALSIKHFDNDLEIALLHDHLAFKKGSFDMSVFDKTIELSESDLSNPAKIKTSIYKYLPYDYNLYLDVDALCLQSLLPLFERLIEKDEPFATHIFETYDITSPDKLPWMYWAKRSTIWDHYGFDESHKLPATQSSIMWIKKCEFTENLYRQLNENLENPIPLHLLSNKWGGAQPDELYLNITLAQLGISPSIGKEVIFFANQVIQKGLVKIEEDYFIMSFFGGKNFARSRYKDYYDRKLVKMCNARGHNHYFKIHTILEHKHADQRTSETITVRERSPRPVREERIRERKERINGNDKNLSMHRNHLQQFMPIEASKEIESKNLIPRYLNGNQRFLAVSNWLNPSVILFNNKKIMCYRMESRPWCVATRLGICLLDENNQPIKESNVLLNLHSDLKGFAKGYHVEDPRLFIYNDELYLSYTDGYQMAQAKLNPETLQAEESFYIKKPIRERTEKNWTFFEHDNKLYSAYSINPHIIYEMHGENFMTAYETEIKTNWKWGILRGGTSPVRISEDHYLSFFHSSLDFKNMERQYFMGAYMFEAKPPFKVTHISKQPFISGAKVSASIPRLNQRIYVVFPGGQLRTHDGYHVFFGYNDFQCRFINITDQMLKDNLMEVMPEKEKEVEKENKLIEA